MNAKQRLSKYLEYKGISQYEFSKRTKLSNGFLNSGKHITFSNLDAITNSFSDLNLVWLVKGIGPMILLQEYEQVFDFENNLDNPHAILREEHTLLTVKLSDEELSKMSHKELVEVNKMLKKLVQAKDETILSQKEIITALQQLLDEMKSNQTLYDRLLQVLDAKE